jgi:hypothetical protein
MEKPTPLDSPTDWAPNLERVELVACDEQELALLARMDDLNRFNSKLKEVLAGVFGALELGFRQMVRQAFGKES